MSIGKTYKPYSAVHGANTLKGLVSYSLSIGASAVSQRADGAVSQTRVYTEGHKATVSLTAEVNESIANFHVGDAAALTVLFYSQLEGANSGALTASRTVLLPKSGDQAHAVLTSISDSAPHNGQPTVTLTFEVAAASGVPADLYTITDV